MKVVLSTLNAKYIHSSLALFSLKASCEQTLPQHQYRIKEYTINNDLLEILSDLFAEKPDVVCFACYIWNSGMTRQLIELVKQVLPEVVVIVGGPEVSYETETFIKENQAVDYVVMGEGEEVLPNLLTFLNRQDEMSIPAGVSCRSEEGIFTGALQVIEELGSLPFGYTNDDMEYLKDKIIYYESSRGCPFSCQYCLSSVAAGVRFLPVERVCEDLDFFIRHNVKQVKFVDRTFNAKKEHYLPIIRFLATQGCRTNFHFEIAADLLDDETIEALLAAPPDRFQLEVGIQSTHEPALKAIKRVNHWDRIVANVSAIVNSETIHLHLDLIVGLPYEGLEEFANSFDAVYRLKPHMLQIGFLKLLKGSGIRTRIEEDGYRFMPEAPYEVLSNRYMSYAEVRRLKILEGVFNQTYNSGRFRRTLDWFIAETGRPFDFYEKLASYWEERKLHLVAHSTKVMYRHLADYCQRYHPKKLRLCMELLKFDALLSDHGQIRPECLPWNEECWEAAKNRFYRDADGIAKYVPDFRFSNWRDTKRKYHLEVFAYRVNQPEDEDYFEQQTVVLFQYEDCGVLIKHIKDTDFNSGE